MIAYPRMKKAVLLIRKMRRLVDLFLSEKDRVVDHFTVVRIKIINSCVFKDEARFLVHVDLSLCHGCSPFEVVFFPCIDRSAQRRKMQAKKDVDILRATC